VFNVTFNNISVIVAVSFIGGGNRSVRTKQPTCRKSDKFYYIMLHGVHPAMSGEFELTTLVVICTDCIGSCKSNCDTIMTTEDSNTHFNDIDNIRCYTSNTLRFYADWSKQCRFTSGVILHWSN
jgi:hypothetical protein